MITPAELTAIPLFADLTREQLDFVASAVEDIRLVPGEFAAREGDERALFLVVEGVMGLTKEVNGIERRVGKRAARRDVRRGAGDAEHQPARQLRRRSRHRGS